MTKRVSWFISSCSALWTALDNDNDEKALRGNFAEYYSWISLESDFAERLDGWKKADGEPWHNEVAVRAHLKTLKSALEGIETRITVQSTLVIRTPIIRTS